MMFSRENSIFQKRKKGIDNTQIHRHTYMHPTHTYMQENIVYICFPHKMETYCFAKYFSSFKHTCGGSREEHLPSMHEALVPSLALHKPSCDAVYLDRFNHKAVIL